MKNAYKRAGVLTVAAAAMALAIGAQAMASSAASVTLPGDANADAAFGVADAVLLSKYLAAVDTLSEQGAANSDMNGDVALNAIDLTLMKRQLLTPSVPVNPDGDNVVTAITYGESSVTLKNASGAVVDAADAANVTVADNTMVTITQPGEYDVDGTCANGQLNINCDKTSYALGQVTCNLLGLNLSNSSDSPIYVTAIDDEFVLTVKNGYTNTISDGTSYTNADAGVGAIYSCDDMKIKGQGTLIVKGNCEDGIVCKNDLKIWNGDIQVTAVDDGIRGKDSVRIGDPDDTDYSSLKVNVTTTSGDGIKSTDETDTTHGFVRVTGGEVTVNSFSDAISAVYSVEINGGTLNLTTTGNSTQAGSAKGLKAGWTDDTTGTAYTGNVTVAGGSITVNSTDDCLHASGDITITGVAGGTVGGTAPTLNLTSGDDGIHADNKVTIGNGAADTYNDLTININDGYEGVEGMYIYQNSGTIFCYVADDIYNAAGGADNSGNNGSWGGGWGGPGMSSGTGYLYLNGGFVWGFNYEGDSDGMDSNGELQMNGGIYITNGSDPIDKGDSSTFTYTGGIFIHGQGNAMMENAASQITNLYSSSASVNSGTVTFTDASGNVIAHFTATGNQMRKVAIAGTTIDANVRMYTGATVTGGTLLGNGLADSRTCYVDGTVSGGTQVTLTAGSNGGNSNPWGW